MGLLHDDVVLIRPSEKDGEPNVITVNCPDKTGLGCDLCRIILFFGLSIVKGDVTTDGKWCYIVFWVTGNSSATKWGLLKQRMMEVCPSCSSASTLSYFRPEPQSSKPPDMFLLKFCCLDRRGLLHDVTRVLCELELLIEKVKVSTTPDGKVMDLFFIIDPRELMHTTMRQQDTCDHLKHVLGDAMISCEIEMVGTEVMLCSQASSLPSEIAEESCSLELNQNSPGRSLASKDVSVTLDNSLSPAHTLVQIVCEDHKGLIYDIMRTLKDYNIKISYGRFNKKQRRSCEIDLFIMQTDGKKILDPSKQNALSTRLRMELIPPLRVAVLSRGPDTELLVANPTELSGKGRPLVFYDITLALKLLDIGIFLAEIRRHLIGDREWEVYRVMLDEGDGTSVPRKKIEDEVRKMLMGWV